jgi:hypothetical protein
MNKEIRLTADMMLQAARNVKGMDVEWLEQQLVQKMFDKREVYLNGLWLDSSPYQLRFWRRGDMSVWKQNDFIALLRILTNQPMLRELGRVCDPNFSEEKFNLAIELSSQIDCAEADYDLAKDKIRKERDEKLALLEETWRKVYCG